MRADRLVATLLLMQARGRVTAAELAEELEISVATARRDLEALSAAGIPVYPQPGRGGGRTGTPSERLLDPYGLVDKDDVWYLIAGTARGRRTFRIDRVIDAELTGEAFERPADFDLSGAWAEVVDRMEERRSGGTATV